jgi:hypothetical protein
VREEKAIQNFTGENRSVPDVGNLETRHQSEILRPVGAVNFAKPDRVWTWLPCRRKNSISIYSTSGRRNSLVCWPRTTFQRALRTKMQPLRPRIFPFAAVARFVQVLRRSTESGGPVLPSDRRLARDTAGA